MELPMSPWTLVIVHNPNGETYASLTQPGSNPRKWSLVIDERDTVWFEEDVYDLVAMIEARVCEQKNEDQEEADYIIALMSDGDETMVGSVPPAR